MNNSILTGTKAVIAASFIVLCVAAAQLPAAAEQMSPSSAQKSAPIDLTGVWVSIVNEDWRWRMLAAPKGDYAGVPLNDAGRSVADAWDISQDGSCKAFGAAGLMRMPMRIRITWESDDILKIESDAGEQTRRFYFAEVPPAGHRTLQGRSVAEWERTVPPGDGWGLGLPTPPRTGGSLKVSTTDLQPGWLRRNGVPYGENARVTEYYDRFSVTQDGAQGSGQSNEWFVVTTVVEDPQYLTRPYITSSHFRREAEPSKWRPRACKN